MDGKTLTTIISYSELFAWQVCHRQYYYKYILGLDPLIQSNPMSTGNNGHKLLQSFYNVMNESSTKEYALEVVSKHAASLMKPGLGADFSVVKAWALVDNYIRDNEFNAEAILVENRFLFPASILDSDPIVADVQIGFTPDVVFKRNGGWLDVEDAKFVQRAWSKTKLDKFLQVKLYKIFLDRMGYDISRCVVRFFNVGTATITTQNYFPEKEEEQTIIRDFMAGIKEVIKYKQSLPSTFIYTPRTLNYMACGGCAFEFPCGLEAEGKSAIRTFNTQYKKKNYDYGK